MIRGGEVDSSAGEVGFSGFAEWNGPFAQRAMWGFPALYGWQEKILRHMYEAFRYAAVSTPNESGKTSVLVPLFGLAVMAAFPGAQVYSTAGSEAQVKDQLFRHLASKVSKFSGAGWRCSTSDLTVTAPAICGMPPSKWIARVPRDALTGEGYHAGVHKDNKGRWRYMPLAMIIDEAKSVGEEVFEMAYRLLPTWLLVVSTPGGDSGPFFRAIGPDDLRMNGVQA